VIEYTITDLRTAAIAVAGVLHAIGAAIDEAVQWLRLIVLDLFADTKHLADVMYSWMTVQGPAAVGSALAASTNAVDGLFAGLKSDIAGFFHSNLPSGTFGSSKPAPPPAGSPQAQASGGNHNVKMNWLHDKLKGSTGPTPPAIGSTHADTIVATLTAQVDTLEADLKTAFDPFIHPDPPIENPADFKDLFSWSTLDQLAIGLLDTACDVADDLIVDVLGFIGDGVTGIVDAMQTPLGSIGGIGDLFDILGIGAVTPGELVCYLIAFPAVIAGDLIALVAGGNHDWIPSLPSALDAGDLLGGFDIGAAVAMVLAIAEITYGALFAAFNTALVVLIASGWPPVNLSLPWYMNWLLNGLQLLIHLLEYPFQSTIVTTATETWLPATVDWGGGVWVGGLSSQAPLFTWLLGFLPDIVSALQKPGPLWGGFQMIVNTLFGFILTGLSLGIAITSDPDAVVLGEAIVGWLPSMFSALMLPASLVSTAGITGAIGVDLNLLESDVYAGFSFAAFAAAI
jgi:hypothetical protein